MIDDISGRRFGRWTMLGSPYRVDKRWRCVARCDCGIEKIVYYSHVVAGRSKSCGCFRSTATSVTMRKHGLSGSRTYKSWKSMRARCLNPNFDNFGGYGGRGITICERWNDFTNFVADMGERPVGTSLDRIDNEKSYGPGNCRWATQKEQNRNTRRTHRVFYEGEWISVSEVAERHGILAGSIIQALRRGSSITQVVVRLKQKAALS